MKIQIRRISLLIMVTMNFVVIAFSQRTTEPNFYEFTSEKLYEPKNTVLELTPELFLIYEFPQRYNLGIVRVLKGRAITKGDTLSCEVDTSITYSANAAFLRNVKINCDSTIRFRIVSFDSLVHIGSATNFKNRYKSRRNVRVDTMNYNNIYVRTQSPTVDVDCVKRRNYWKRQLTDQKLIICDE